MQGTTGASKGTCTRGKQEPKVVQSKLRCLYTNIDGLNKVKGDELCIAFSQQKPHLVFVTETKMQADKNIQQFIDCSNYHVFNKDRKSGYGGGVLILVSNELVVKEFTDKSWEDIEAVS